MNEALKHKITETLINNLSKEVEINAVQPVGGGSINQAARLETTAGKYFVKWNRANAYPEMFEFEMKGLELLRNTGTLEIPETLAAGTSGNDAFLVMEWIAGGKRRADFYGDFGQRLAKLHRNTAYRFGLDYDNYIGSLSQQNNWHDVWTAFFIEERMMPMVKMARDNGNFGQDVVRRFEKMYSRLNEIFPKEPASLMHGDLWGGNHITGSNGSVCLIDPAVYYGNREMEIAFTRVFSGNPSEFYAAYNAEWPLQPGFTEREGIYQLWPLMVHVNLFGNSYLPPVKSILRAF